MIKLVLSAIAVLATAIAVAYMLPSASDSRASAEFNDKNDVGRDAASLPLERRLAALERTIAEERQARQLLQEELLFLTEEIESLRVDGAPARGRAAAAETQEVVAVAEGPGARRERFANRNSAEYRVQRLIDAGFSPERAEYLYQRESALRMSLIEARYEAERNGDAENLGSLRQAEMEAFRNELGPSEYERYLEGTGRSTSVVVGSVLDTSPAQRVGIQPGDEILSYGGTRVYNMSDLNRAMQAGVAGETVAAEIVRDGVTMQVALKRGPLGITTGRRGRR
ncbi:MAG: PDZ domain-containing protein [Woeseia sp.]